MATYVGLLVLKKLLEQIESEHPTPKFPAKSKICFGKVGTMSVSDIFGSIITAAKKENITCNTYREEHALYASINDALHGVCRGNIGLRETLRTISLRFVLLRGECDENEPGDWFIVILYGNIGSTTKGHEHEVMGFGMCPVS